MRLAWSKLLVLPFVAVLVFGCAAAVTDVEGVGIVLARRNGLFVTNGAPATAGSDYFLQMKAKKTAPGLAFMQMSRDLWQPFRWEAAGGLYDPDHLPNDGAIVCTELDGRGTNFATFYGLCAQVTGGGMLVYAYKNGSASAIGSKFFAAAQEIEFAIETDLTTMTFLARERGEVAYSTIATTPFTGQAIPLIPAAGVNTLGNKGVIGFDDFRVVSNGTPGVAPTAEQAAADTIWTAVDGILEAAYLLEGLNPDFDAAAPLLTQAQTDLATAIAAVEALPASKARTKALKELNKAPKKLQNALDHVNEDDAAAAFVDLKPALSRPIKAILKLYPIS